MTTTASLEGRRVVVTRAAEQATELVDAIEAAGGVAVRFPLLEIRDPDGGLEPLAAAIASIGTSDWVAVTSPNGARQMIRAAAPQPQGSVAVIGAATREVFEAHGWATHFEPTESTAATMADQFPEVGHGRVVVVQGDLARPTLIDGLRRRGVHVDAVVAYRNVEPEPEAADVAAAANADVVVFASPSAVERYLRWVGQRPANAVCIGPVTAEAAATAGFDVTVAAEPTIDALVEAIAAPG